MNSTRSTATPSRRDTVPSYIPPHARRDLSTTRARGDVVNSARSNDRQDRGMRKDLPQIDRFFESRMPPTPALDHSHFSSDSEDDDPFETHSPVQRSNRYTPFLASSTKNYRLSTIALDDSSWFDHPVQDSLHFTSYSKDDIIALEEMAQPKLLQSISLPLIPCSSCGREPPGRPFISLQPCDHLLCAECVNALVNAASNDPPRVANCFCCRAEIINFVGVDFELDEAASGGSAGKVGGDGVDVYRTPEKAVSKKLDDSFAELSPFRTIDWATECATPIHSTPGTSPESASSPRSARSSPSTPFVVRVDNIRWNITVAAVEAWIPSSISRIPFRDQPLSIHILCNRADGKTLNQLYIELPTLQAAQSLVRLKNERPLAGRLVAVGLSTPEELLEHIFPAWEAAGSDARRLDVMEDELIAQEDLDGLIKMCRLEGAHATKAPERAFFNIATLIIKLPWHRLRVVDGNLTLRIFKTVETAIGLILQNRTKFDDRAHWRDVVEILVTSAINCRGFRPAQRSRLLALPRLAELGIDHIIPTERKHLNLQEMTSLTPGSSPALRSPTLDRVKAEHVTPSPPRFISQIPRTNLSPTPIRQSFVADLFGSPQRSAGVMEVVGEDGGEEVEKMESISRELEVDLEMVKLISRRLGA